METTAAPTPTTPSRPGAPRGRALRHVLVGVGVLALAGCTGSVSHAAGTSGVPTSITTSTAPTTTAGSDSPAAGDTTVPADTTPDTPAPTEAATTAAPSPAAAGSGHFSGGDQTLTVSFDSDGKAVSNFSAQGGWYCYPQGEQVMSFVIPQSFPIAADGTFGGTVSGTVSGINMTWTVNGTVTGSGSATGGLTVGSDNYCKLYPTNWSVSR